MSLPTLLSLLLAASSTPFTGAFHDCVEASARIRQRRQQHYLGAANPSSASAAAATNNAPSCAGGICVGMTNGPHQGGNASYPVAWNGTTGTFVHSTMTVPQLPQKLDGITYYLWTDVFFGDASLGRMNQFVPQLLLGDVLDGSSGPPEYKPIWDHHATWVFGAHYFFETWNTTTKQTDAHASYGELYPTWAGETLFTTFELKRNDNIKGILWKANSSTDPPATQWILTMGVVGDQTRVSQLVIDQPYMGMGQHWQQPTTSWLESSYKNMCINACWEIYGAPDSAHLPSSGARYNLTIVQPLSSSNNNSENSNNNLYPFTSWERDEGNGICPSCQVTERHKNEVQTVMIDIGVSDGHPSVVTDG